MAGLPSPGKTLADALVISLDGRATNPPGLGRSRPGELTGELHGRHRCVKREAMGHATDRAVVAASPVFAWPARQDPDRAMRGQKALTLLAVLAALLAGCSQPSAPPLGPGQLLPVDGVWGTVGYGWIFSVNSGRAEWFETTAISCLPSRTLLQLGKAGSDGALRFGDEHRAVQATLRRTDGGHGVLRLAGTVADIDLVQLPDLPAECTRSTPDDPLTTFDVFWSTFAENYNSFLRKHVDWDVVRAKYRGMINNSTSDSQLYEILVEMVEPLGDAHVCVQGPHEKSFCGKRSGTRDDVEVPRRTATTAVNRHLREDLGVRDIQPFAGGKIAYADLPDGHGYLRITSFQDYSDDDTSPYPDGAEMSKALDVVFTQARVHAWRGLVIDVRWNDGGDDVLALQVAGRLTNTPYPAYTKAPRVDPHDPTRHGPDRPVTVNPANGPRYTGPVRLLVSDLTISAGETFIEAMMGRAPAPTRIGSTTQGVFADDMERTLPNGWTFTLGNEEYVAPDGQNYEGVGIPPTVQVPVFTPAELAQHQDSALSVPW
jgi:Peptidase family S41/Tricorn protease C1 domain